MNILIVNDDGYQSKGIEILVRALTPHGKIYVSAPYSEQSAKSHGITITNKIEIKKVPLIPGTMDTIAVKGSPADATRVGLKVFNVDFDLVVSGINNGPNIAKDILYSGTVAAAKEARVSGVPAVALSADTLELDYLYDETIKIMDEIINDKLYEVEGILNVNFPKQTFTRPKGVLVTTQGLRHFHSEFIESKTENTYYIKSSITQYQEDETSDVRAYNEGFVSVTPLTLERTDYIAFEKLIKFI